MIDLKENFSIIDVIDADLINLELKARNKNEVISELSQMLLEKEILKNKEDFIKDVFLREEEGMTGLGKGVAIPHGKSESVKKTSIVIGRVAKPIDWESLDDEPVNIIILFAVRNIDETTTHIKLLQKVAILLADEDFISQLQTVKTKEEMLTLLSKNPEG
ncbi:MAG: PTS sugar transporter subunit IIA [Lactovum sp.]